MIMVIAKIKIVSNALYSYHAADLTCHWMIGGRFSRERLRLVINILLENCTMMSSTLCFWDCTISHFGLHKLHLGLHKLVGLQA